MSSCSYVQYGISVPIDYDIQLQNIASSVIVRSQLKCFYTCADARDARLWLGVKFGRTLLTSTGEGVMAGALASA
jgi:hypothetical protein